MTSVKIMGYWVSDDPAVLEAFLKNMREWYDILDQTREPITKTIRNLDQDWKPRWAEYWKRVIQELGPLREAERGCLFALAREQSCESIPAPLVLAATSIMYIAPLNTLEAKIEDAGILMTAYIEMSDSHQEKHLRQRQAVLKALRAVDVAAQEAVFDGRTTELNQALQEQQKLLTPRQLPSEETPTTGRSSDSSAAHWIEACE